MERMVKEFQKAMDVPIGKKISPENIEDFALNMRLIREEAYELDDELSYAFMQMSNGEMPDNIEKIYKETADLLYVVFHFTNVFNIPIQKVFAEVHRSNMSKLGDDGKPVKDKHGKVTKGPNYRSPDIKKYVRNYANE